MSTTIDQRVVEMRFDNKQFENNVSNSMSTLEKLKRSLNLTGASKGLENVNAAAKNVNMNGLGSAVESVSAKFSALQVMGVTALANITNSAVNTGKRMLKALTLDPITTGFSEYETKINSIQTIMSNTASKGTTMADVTRVINELNTYADKTIYNFAEMTRNIGTFTAAGVGLEESAAAIQGIANLAAASGSSSQQASTAMYQLSQALAAGTVKLMDWNSVVNAGMGGEKFQEALKATAREHGIAVDKMIEKNGSFRESLSEGWITADVLNDTLRKFTVEGAKEYADAMVASGKYTKEQADALMAEATAMEEAATKVKTFTQLWDTMKESVQSGWSQTWELFIGDFEEAREFLSNLSEIFGGVINKISDTRNNILGGALNSKWDELIGLISEAGVQVEDFEQKVKDCAKDGGVDVEHLTEEYGSLRKAIEEGALDSKFLKKALKDIGKVSKNVTSGLANIKRELKFGDTGDDIKELQTALELLGYNLEKHGVDGIFGPETKAAVIEFQKAAKIIDHIGEAGIVGPETIESIIKAAEATKELGENGDQATETISELIDELSRPSGRALLFTSIENALEAIGKILKIFGESWRKVFDVTDEEKSDNIYKFIKSIHDLSAAFLELVSNKDIVNQIRNITDGIAAAFDVSWYMFKGSLVSTIKLVTAVLGLFDMTLIDVAEDIAQVIIKFRDWVKTNTMFIGMTDKLARIIQTIIEGAKRVVDAFLSLNIISEAVTKIWNKLTEVFGKFSLKFDGFSVDGIITTLNSLFDSIVSWIKELDGSEAARNFVNGLVNGLLSGIDWVVSAITKVGKAVIDAICVCWREHSPSKEAYEIGEYFIIGLVNGIQAAAGFAVDVVKGVFSGIGKAFGKIDWRNFWNAGVTIVKAVGNGIKNAVPGLWSLVTALFSKLSDIVKEVDLGTIISGIASVLAVKGFTRIANILDKFAGAFEGFGKLMSSAAGVVGQFKMGLKAITDSVRSFSFEMKASAIKNIAIAIGLLVASIAVLAYIPQEGLDKAINALLTISIIIGVLSVVISKFGTAGTGVTDAIQGMTNIAKATGLILGIAVSILLIAGAAKLISGVSWPDLGKIAAVAVGFIVLAGALIKAIAKADANLEHANKTIAKMGMAMLMLALVAKIIAGMEPGEMVRAGIGLAAFAMIMSSLLKSIGKAGENVEHAGKTIRKMATAMLILVIVAKIIARMEWDEMGKAAVGLAGLSAIIIGLAKATTLAGGQKKLENAARMLTAMGVCILLLVYAAKIIAGMTWAELGKAAVGILGLSGIIVGLTAATKLAGGGAKLKNVASTLISMGICVALIAGISAIVGLIDLKQLAKGVLAVGFMSSFVALMASATKNTKDVHQNIMWMAISIGILALSAAILAEIPTKDLVTAAGAMSLMMVAFAGLLWSTSKLKKIKIGPVLTMLVVVIALTGIIYLLSALKCETAFKTVASLSILLLTFAGSLRILATGGRVSKSVAAQIGWMFLVTIGLGAILSAMSFLPNPENLIPIATSLSILLLAFTGSLRLLATGGSVSKTVATQIWTMVGVVAVLGVVLSAMSFLPNPENLIPIATSLSILLLSMSGVLAILSLVGPAGSAASAGAMALVKVMAILAAVAIAIGVLMSFIPQEWIDQWKQGIDKFMSLLVSLASGLGEVIGAFIGGIAMGALAGLGSGLSAFMTNLQPFLDGVKDVGLDHLAGAGSLLGVMTLFAGSAVLGTIGSIFGLSLPLVGLELSKFMENAGGFFEGVEDIDEGVANSVLSLSKAILYLTAADVLDGLTSLLTGGSSLADFGAELAEFGPSIKKFSDDVKGIDNASVKVAAEAAKTLAEMAQALPNSGGLLGKIFGENDMDTFGTQLSSFGKSLVGYSSAVTGINISGIDASVTAATKLSDLANSLPSEGGLLAVFTGDNSMATFGSNLRSFGRALLVYSSSVAQIKIDGIDASITAATKLSNFANSLPNEGGLFATFAGDNTMAGFGSGIVSFGKAIVDYASSVCGIDISGVDASLVVGRKLKRFINSLTDLDIYGISIFKNAIEELGTVSLDAVRAAFSGGIPDIAGMCAQLVNSMTTTFNMAAPRMSAAGVLMASSVSTGISSGSHSILTTLSSIVSGAITTVTSRAIDFYSAGMSFITEMAAGIFDNSGNVETRMTSAAGAGVTGARSKYQGFKSAGAYCVSGFVNGIYQDIWKSTAAGKAIAKEALEAARRELDERSPSKAFYQIGDYAGIGFINALIDNVRPAYRASSEMAKASLSGVSNAISQIGSKVASDIDVTPRIKPVLDLSDVQNGARSINRMFANQSLQLAGINADFTADSTNVLTDVVSQMQKMNSDSNDKLVGEITNLRRDFGSLVTAIGGLHIRMDSGTVVGELIGRIDSGLGQIATYKGRGN